MWAAKLKIRWKAHVCNTNLDIKHPIDDLEVLGRGRAGSICVQSRGLVGQHRTTGVERELMGECAASLNVNKTFVRCVHGLDRAFHVVLTSAIVQRDARM